MAHRSYCVVADAHAETSGVCCARRGGVIRVPGALSVLTSGVALAAGRGALRGINKLTLENGADPWCKMPDPTQVFSTKTFIGYYEFIF